jgi:two-component system LytT family sensor kinase
MWTKNRNMQLKFMHPAIFITAWTALGTLFALQDWMNMRRWGFRVGPAILFESWGTQFFIWGSLAWLIWRLLGSFIQSATLVDIFTRVLPLSIATSVVEEMIWVLCFPNLPLNRAPMAYWQRLAFHLDAEFVDSLVIFWSAFALFRGIGFYEQFREKENVAAALEVELVNARMSALRMQLNPHFLFNAMNSISSLMRIDIDTADTMLEQLSNLLRITLERGDVQMIPLRDEIEFVEMYLSMQAQRYKGRVRQTVWVDPELHDALVPAMILQPLVENAYVHGLSKLTRGDLSVEAHIHREHLELIVINSGIGIKSDVKRVRHGQEIGLANIESRLKCLYGVKGSLSIKEMDPEHVQVVISLPIVYSHALPKSPAKFGV